MIADIAGTRRITTHYLSNGKDRFFVLEYEVRSNRPEMAAVENHYHCYGRTEHVSGAMFYGRLEHAGLRKKHEELTDLGYDVLDPASITPEDQNDLTNQHNELLAQHSSRCFALQAGDMRIYHMDDHGMIQHRINQLSSSKANAGTIIDFDD